MQTKKPSNLTGGGRDMDIFWNHTFSLIFYDKCFDYQNKNTKHYISVNVSLYCELLLYENNTVGYMYPRKYS